MPAASAPGKVYLFGEHAVVYGEPAVPCAIDRRVTASVDRRSDGRIRIDSPALRFDGATVELDEDGSTVDVDEDRARHAVRYVTAALDRVRTVADDPAAGFNVSLESELPIGAGLGSSAAVAVATIDAGSRACGTALEPDAVAEAGYQVEAEVQGGEASRADTYCSAMGGAVRVEGTDRRRLDAPALPLVIGYDGQSGDTGTLVAGVRSLKESYGFAAETVAAIGDLVRAGEDHLESGALEELGTLMDSNHGLLSALGVSGRSLDAMVWAAREAGALGAKLTGAGGGGCIVALDPTDGAETALAHTAACERAFRAPLSPTGVERE